MGIKVHLFIYVTLGYYKIKHQLSETFKQIYYTDHTILEHIKS